MVALSDDTLGWCEKPGNTHRLDNPLLLAPAFFESPLKLLNVAGQNKCLWNEAKLLLAELQLEPVQVAPQSVFAANLKRAREVVHLETGSTRFALNRVIFSVIVFMSLCFKPSYIQCNRLHGN